MSCSASLFGSALAERLTTARRADKILCRFSEMTLSQNSVVMCFRETGFDNKEACLERWHHSLFVLRPRYLCDTSEAMRGSERVSLCIRLDRNRQSVLFGNAPFRPHIHWRIDMPRVGFFVATAKWTGKRWLFIICRLMQCLLSFDTLTPLRAKRIDDRDTWISSRSPLVIKYGEASPCS